MTTIQLGGRPLADFSEPIRMLKDCHRRIEHFLGVLQKVERRYGAKELDEAGRRALEAGRNYFANFAPRHTADEEQSLFPRLRDSDDPEVRTVMAELDQLEDDHRRCEEGHAVVDEIVGHWLTTGRLDDERRNRLRESLAELAGVYAEHIRVEEEQVFAAAARILNPGDVRAIGKEMRERRQLGTS